MSDAAVKEIQEVIARHGGQMHKVDHPVVTLEDLFLRIVKQSQERPGQRFTTDGAGPARATDGVKPAAPVREPATAGEQK